MELQVLVPGKSAQPLSVSDQTFAHKYNEALVHQVVVAYLAGARQGSHVQKNRSAVKGGGKKPWKQKGTGRARAGTIRSPLWRGGGVTFAAVNADYSQKINKKMYRSALRSIVSELVRQDRLAVVETIPVVDGKTKEVVKFLAQFDAKKVLLVTDELDEKVYYAARNIRNVDVLDVVAVDPVSLVNFDKVVMTTAAVKKLEERLQ